MSPVDPQSPFDATYFDRPLHITKRSIEIQALFRRWLECRIDVETTCPACRKALRTIASIEDSEVIEKILNHLSEKSACLDTYHPPYPRI